MLWRLAGWPTRTWPSSVKATIDGVVRPPSAFSITLALFPSITATQELVVPRSMPIAFAMIRLLVQKMRANAFAVSDYVRLICGTRQVRREERRPARPAAAWGSSGGLILLLGLFLDLDFLRLGFGRLRNRDLQDAVRHGGLNARRIDAGRQLQHAQEYAVAALAELNVFVFLVFLDLLLAANGEGVIVNRNLDVVALEARHLRADFDCLVGFRDFDVGDNLRARAYPLREFAEQPINLAMQAEQSEIRSRQHAAITKWNQ